MSDNAYKFDIPKHHKSIIKVIGVGGGGSNAVNHMFNQGIKDVEFIVCNTDAQALKSSPVPNKLQIGVNLTEGLGAGANPEKGKDAAIESKEEIRDLLGTDTKMVFITAGMGGGTGTGAAPVIANVAKDMDILTVGIVTAPFKFEGKKKMNQAAQGITFLKDNCDTVLVISNDKLREMHGNLSIGNAFAQADNILTTAAKGIAEIITVAGYVNVDFQDVRTVMFNAGAAVMGSAETKGENRARKAAEEALSSPLLDNKDIYGAEKILLSIISGEQAELQMDELTEITEYIQEQSGEDAEVIFGHGVDPDLEDSIRVTLIATGFENYQAKMKEKEAAEARQLEGKAELPKAAESEEPEAETKVFDLESNKQISLFQKNERNGINQEEQDNEAPIPRPFHTPPAPDRSDRGYSFTGPTTPPANTNAPQTGNSNEGYGDNSEDDDGLFSSLEDEFDIIDDNGMDQYIGDDGMMGFISTEDRLKQQAQERVQKLKGLNKTELNADEFKEKLDVPAYLRKQVKLENVPHSSERNISKYNLNDDNQILGNNRFLHDNVD